MAEMYYKKNKLNVDTDFLQSIEAMETLSKLDDTEIGDIEKAKLTIKFFDSIFGKDFDKVKKIIRKESGKQYTSFQDLNEFLGKLIVKQ